MTKKLLVCTLKEVYTVIRSNTVVQRAVKEDGFDGQQMGE